MVGIELLDEAVDLPSFHPSALCESLCFGARRGDLWEKCKARCVLSVVFRAFA